MHESDGDSSVVATATAANLAGPDVTKKKRRRVKKKKAGELAATAAAKPPPQASRVWIDDTSFERKVVAAGWDVPDASEQTGTIGASGTGRTEGARVGSDQGQAANAGNAWAATEDSENADANGIDNGWSDPAIAALLRDALAREERQRAMAAVRSHGAAPHASAQRSAIPSAQPQLPVSAWDTPVVGVHFLATTHTKNQHAGTGPANAGWTQSSQQSYSLKQEDVIVAKAKLEEID